MPGDSGRRRDGHWNWIPAGEGGDATQWTGAVILTAHPNGAAQHPSCIW